MSVYVQKHIHAYIDTYMCASVYFYFKKIHVNIYTRTVYNQTRMHIHTDVAKVRMMYSSTKLAQNIQCHEYCQNT